MKMEGEEWGVTVFRAIGLVVRAICRLQHWWKGAGKSWEFCFTGCEREQEQEQPAGCLAFWIRIIINRSHL